MKSKPKISLQQEVKICPTNFSAFRVADTQTSFERITNSRNMQKLSIHSTKGDARGEARTSKRKAYNRKPKIWFTGVAQTLIKASQDNQDASSMVKVNSFSGSTKRIAIDCEFVGVGYGGKDNALARVSVVNQFGHTLIDAYVRPRERVVDYRTHVSGITPEHLRPGGPARDFISVQKEIADLCQGRVLIGHAIKNDLKVLQLAHPRKDIRDTSLYRPFRALFEGRTPSLRALTERVVGICIQSTEHDSVEDARAAMRLYTSVKRIWESGSKFTRLRHSSGREIGKLTAHFQSPVFGSQQAFANGHGIRMTKLASIASDVMSQFSSGLHLQRGEGVSEKLTSSASRVNRVDDRGRKCSKNRIRYLEKRKNARISRGRNYASSSLV